jgi:hypothetical protein
VGLGVAAGVGGGVVGVGAAAAAVVVCGDELTMLLGEDPVC